MEGDRFTAHLTPTRISCTDGHCDDCWDASACPAERLLPDIIRGWVQKQEASRQRVNSVESAMPVASVESKIAGMKHTSLDEVLMMVMKLNVIYVLCHNSL